DQAPLDTQEKLLSQVERWHQSTKLNLWRIILPMWQRTFDRYTSNEYNLLRGAQTFRIGTLSDSTLIQKRVGGLVAEAAKIALEGELASRRTEWGRYLADMIPLVENRIGLKIRDLTNGDLRTELHLLEGVLSSEGAYSVWNLAQGQPQRH